MGFRRCRQLAGYTQQQVAEALNVSQSTVAMWDTGDASPRSAKLIEIAKLYGCTVDELLQEERKDEQ